MERTRGIKAIFLLLLFVSAIILLVGCSDKLSCPTELRVEEGSILFDGVEEDVKYQGIFIDESGKVYKKEIYSGMKISEVDIPIGKYSLTIKSIKGDLESKESSAIEITKTNTMLKTPTNLMIDNDYVFFNETTSNISYKLLFKNVESGVEFERTCYNGISIHELLVPAGTYDIKIKAVGDDEVYLSSNYSPKITYTKEDKTMVLKEKDLITGGYVKWMGRTYYNNETKLNEVYHSASGFEVFFVGTKLSVKLHATNYSNVKYRPYVVVVINDDFDNAKTVILSKEITDLELATIDPLTVNDATPFKVSLYKRSESIDSHIMIEEIVTDGAFIQKIEEKEHKIEFIAASSSTGYGNLSRDEKTTENSDALRAFAFLTAKDLNSDISIYSASGWGCKASMWTTPNTLNLYDAYKKVDFYSNVDWNYGKFIPDVVVINLGTNDWSYINASKNETEKDQRMSAFQKQYVEFLKYLHQIYPDAQIIVLYGLMNESSIYDATETIVRNARVAIPNLKSIKINGDSGGYNSHPSLSSHRTIAQELTTYIKGLMGW